MKKWWNNNFAIVIVVVQLIIVLAIITTSITACVMYGNKPITEIPAWALMFMFGVRRGK